MLKLLIVIPAYNEAESITRVVDDLIQNYPQYDYVVVNDGSPVWKAPARPRFTGRSMR